jgi:hypothetical protein
MVIRGNADTFTAIYCHAQVGTLSHRASTWTSDNTYEMSATFGNTAYYNSSHSTPKKKKYRLVVNTPTILCTLHTL